MVELENWEKTMFDEMSEMDDKHRKTHGITFTPLVTVNYMLDLIDVSKIDYERYKVLEPSCGAGIFVLAYINKIFQSNKKMTDRQIIHLVKNINAYDIEDHFILGLRVSILKLVEKLKPDFGLLLELKKIVETNILCDNFLMLTSEKKFDLVIGNPPYVRRHNMDVQTQALVKRKEFKDIYNGLADLSLFFVEKANQFLSKGGKIVFITSNKFIMTKYGSKFRKKYYGNLSFYSDNYDTPFHDVQIDTCVIVIDKEMADSFIADGKNLSKDIYNYFDGKEWFFGEKKKERVGRSLIDLGITISNGLVSGYNVAHILDKSKRDEFIKADKSLEKVIREIISGKDLDLEKNHYKSSKYIIYAVGENLKLISKNKALMSHFEEHRVRLEGRSWYQSHTSSPFFQLQGNTQHFGGEYNFCTKRIGDLHFIKVPSDVLYMDTVYNLVYPKNIDVEELLKILRKKEVLESFYVMSNKIGQKYEIHKNKFERIILSESEIKKILTK